MKVVAILQARLGSTRLPGKVLLPLAGQPMVRQILERVQWAKTLDALVLAVPGRDAAALAPMAHGLATLYADPGDEADLVGRYLGAAASVGADLIVRIPCDNPCVDPAYVDAAVADYLRDPVIYYSNTTAACEGQYLDGIGAEVVSLSRLKWLDQRTRGNPSWREHPHAFFRDYGLLRLPKAEVRLDVNTHEDYLFIQALYDHFGHPRFTTLEILTYLRSLN